MTAAQLRRQIKEAVDQLPQEQLEEVATVVTAISRRPGDPSAADHTKILALKRRLANAERDFTQGRQTPVAKLRRKY